MELVFLQLCRIDMFTDQIHSKTVISYSIYYSSSLFQTVFLFFLFLSKPDRIETRLRRSQVEYRLWTQQQPQSAGRQRRFWDDHPPPSATHRSDILFLAARQISTAITGSPLGPGVETVRYRRTELRSAPAPPPLRFLPLPSGHGPSDLTGQGRQQSQRTVQRPTGRHTRRGRTDYRRPEMTAIELWRRRERGEGVMAGLEGWRGWSYGGGERERGREGVMAGLEGCRGGSYGGGERERERGREGVMAGLEEWRGWSYGGDGVWKGWRKDRDGWWEGEREGTEGTEGGDWVLAATEKRMG